MFNYLPERPLEPPEDVIVGYCNQCGGEIYEGEEVYDIDCCTVHEDCLLDYVRAYDSLVFLDYVREHLAVKREAGTDWALGWKEAI